MMGHHHLLRRRLLRLMLSWSECCREETKPDANFLCFLPCRRPHEAPELFWWEFLAGQSAHCESRVATAS